MIEELDDSIYFSIQPEDVVVVKINGRGSFKNSACFQQLFEQLIKEGRKPRFILDLKNCVSMDSTFMGVLASIGKNQTKMSLGKMIAINHNQQTERLLKTLGLNFILDIKESAPNVSEPSDNSFIQKKAEPFQSKIEQIIHMLQAHQTLVDIDTQNEARFHNVIFYLKDSLAREQQNTDDTSSKD